jgi:hypothetical protein
LEVLLKLEAPAHPLLAQDLDRGLVDRLVVRVVPEALLLLVGALDPAVSVVQPVGPVKAQDKTRI